MDKNAQLLCKIALKEAKNAQFFKNIVHFFALILKFY